MSATNFDLIVIGTGVTGLAAAKQAAQKGVKTATVESLMFGGLVININELEPAPPGIEPFAAVLVSDKEKYGRFVKAANVKLD